MRSLAVLAAGIWMGAAVGQQTPALRLVGLLPRDSTAVQFVSAKDGWCSTTRDLYRSADGGRNWVRVQTPVYDPRRIQFLDARNGWVGTGGDSIYWTHDGGGTWTDVRLPLRVVYDVRFATPKTGWVLGMLEKPGDPLREFIQYRIAGENSVYVPELFRSDDGGRTWKQKPYPDIKSLPWRIDFADAQHGVSAEFNATLYTRDGGESWHRSQYGADVKTKQLRSAELGSDMFFATAAQLVDAEYGWWSVEGDLFRTTDGGASWRQLESPRWHGRLVRIHGLRFVDRKRGWAVASRLGQSSPMPGFRTLDGGVTWEAYGMPLGAEVGEVTAAEDGAVFFWGEDRLYMPVR
jgi:photosystem II stability/assembly factor-like uncharacterized protein